MAVYVNSIKLFFRGNPHLKAYWTWNKDYIPDVDESGNNNNLTAYGSIIKSHNSPLGGSRLISGSGNYFVAPEIGFPHTVMAWFKVKSANASCQVYRFGPTTGCNPSSIGYFVSFDNGIGKIGGSVGCEDQPSDTIILPVDEWVFCAWSSKIGTNGHFRFFNGRITSFRNWGTSQSIGSGNCRIGMSYSGGVAYYSTDFILGEMAIFSRNLSPAEISAYYKWAIKKKTSYYSVFCPPPFLAKTTAFFYNQALVPLSKTVMLNFNIFNYFSKKFLSVFDIQGLTDAPAKIKAIVKDIKTRFRVKAK